MPPSNRAAQPERTVPADPLALIPADYELVGYVDVDKLRTSPLWQRVMPRLVEQAGPTLGQLRDACGVDPIASIRSFAFGMREIQDNATRGVIVVRGLERDKWMPCLDSPRMPGKGAFTVDRGVVTATDPEGRRMLFVFADATTLVGYGGTRTPTRDELDQLVASGVPLKASPAFAELIGKLRTTDPIWFLANGNSRAFESAAPLIGVKPKAVYGSLDPSAGLAATLRARLDTPDAAKRLADMANGQLSSGQAAMIKNLVERVEVTADAADFVLQVRATQAQLDTLLPMLGISLAP